MARRSIYRILSILLVVVLIFGIVPPSALADGGTDTPIATGTVSDGGAPWRLYSDGTLFVDSGTIHWTGLSSPWSTHRANIHRIRFTGPILAGNSLRVLFSGLETLTTIEGLDYFDTSNVTDMARMFGSASSLTSLDLSAWDTGNVRYMWGMFHNTNSLTDLNLSGWDTRSVTNMQTMFGRSGLTALDLSDWDTRNVTSMMEMFVFSPNLISLDLSGWDTSNVTSMARMFSNMPNLTSLDLSGWSTSSVTRMAWMFSNTNSLRELTLGEQFRFRLTRDCSPGIWPPETTPGYVDVGLPAVPDNATYTGRWQLQGGDIVLTSEELMDNLGGAGTWGWQRTPQREARATFFGNGGLPEKQYVQVPIGMISSLDELLAMVEMPTREGFMLTGWAPLPTAGFDAAFEARWEPVTPPVCKAELQMTVYMATLRCQTNHTPESWASFVTVLEAAKAVLANENATQAEVDTAAQTLGALIAPRPLVDRTALQIAIAIAEHIWPPDDGWTTPIVRPIEQALAAARAVLANPNATQAEVNAATDALMAAMDALLRERLQALFDTPIIEPPNGWTPATWMLVMDALAYAHTVLADADATPFELDAAYQNLRAALNNLTPIVNRAALAAVIEEAKTLDRSGYAPPGFWMELDMVLGAAQVVYDYPNATQQQVDDATDALITAIQALRPPFPDTMNWARPYVLEAYASGIVLREIWCDDYNDYIFMPGADATRAMAADFIWRTAGAPAPTNTTIPFTDVTASDPFVDAVLWAHENNIIRGRPADDGTVYFAPGDTLERRELSTMLKRLAAYFGVDTTNLPPHTWPFFNDHADIGWAEDYIRWNFAVRLLLGDDYRNVNPQRETERAEAVTTVVRFARVFAN